MKKKSRNPTPLAKRSPTETPEEIQDQIRRRAYELYEARGRGDGYDLDDWLQAEFEVTQKSKPPKALQFVFLGNTARSFPASGWLSLLEGAGRSITAVPPCAGARGGAYACKEATGIS